MANQDDYYRKFSSMEQAATGMRPVATLMSTYFNALIENGLTRPEALKLTESYQNLFLRASFKKMFKESDDESDEGLES